MRFSKRQMYVRIYAPTLAPDGAGWRCAFAIGAPVSVRGRGEGSTSLQALVDAMRGVSRALYTSSAFRRRQIGGPNGRSMFFPATSDLHEVTPDRF